MSAREKKLAHESRSTQELGYKRGTQLPDSSKVQ